MDGACRTSGRGSYKVLMGKREGKRPPVDLSANGTIILKPTINKQHGPEGGGACTGLIWVSISTRVGRL